MATIHLAHFVEPCTTILKVIGLIPKLDGYILCGGMPSSSVFKQRSGWPKTCKEWISTGSNIKEHWITAPHYLTETLLKQH